MRARPLAPFALATAIALTLGSACTSKEDDDGKRSARKHRQRAAEAEDDSGAGDEAKAIPSWLSCPFGLCGGGGGGGPAGSPEHVCQRMLELGRTDPSVPKIDPTSEATQLKTCVEQMVRMQKDQPHEYETMARCVDVGTQMKDLIDCMMKSYLDGGVK